MKPLNVISALTGFILCVATPSFAMAQSGSSDPDFEGGAGAVILNGLAVVTRQDLWFGVVAPNANSSGTVTVRYGSDHQTECSSELICLSPGHRARFTIVGEPDQLVIVRSPSQIQIFGPGDASMTVDTFSGGSSGNDFEWHGLQRIRGYGFSRFEVGATLHVNPNQPAGRYVGSFVLTVEYQ